MNFEELKSAVDSLYNDNNKNNKVYIKLKEVAIGPIATTEIKSIYPGFDWDHGKILIDTEEDIELVNKDKLNKQRVLDWLDNAITKNYSHLSDFNTKEARDYICNVNDIIETIKKEIESGRFDI